MKKKKDLNFSYSQLSWILTAIAKLSGITDSVGLSVALALNSSVLSIGKKGMATLCVAGETIF